MKSLALICLKYKKSNSSSIWRREKIDGGSNNEKGNLHSLFCMNIWLHSHPMMYIKNEFCHFSIITKSIAWNIYILISKHTSVRRRGKLKWVGRKHRSKLEEGWRLRLNKCRCKGVNLSLLPLTFFSSFNRIFFTSTENFHRTITASSIFSSSLSEFSIVSSSRIHSRRYIWRYLILFRYSVFTSIFKYTLFFQVLKCQFWKHGSGDWVTF